MKSWMQRLGRRAADGDRASSTRTSTTGGDDGGDGGDGGVLDDSSIDLFILTHSRIRRHSDLIRNEDDEENELLAKLSVLEEDYHRLRYEIRLFSSEDVRRREMHAGEKECVGTLMFTLANTYRRMQNRPIVVGNQLPTLLRVKSGSVFDDRPGAEHAGGDGDHLGLWTGNNVGSGSGSGGGGGGGDGRGEVGRGSSISGGANVRTDRSESVFSVLAEAGLFYRSSEPSISGARTSVAADLLQQYHMRLQRQTSWKSIHDWHVLPKSPSETLVALLRQNPLLLAQLVIRPHSSSSSSAVTGPAATEPSSSATAQHDTPLSTDGIQLGSPVVFHVKLAECAFDVLYASSMPHQDEKLLFHFVIASLERCCASAASISDVFSVQSVSPVHALLSMYWARCGGINYLHNVLDSAPIVLDIIQDRSIDLELNLMKIVRESKTPPGMARLTRMSSLSVGSGAVAPGRPLSAPAELSNTWHGSVTMPFVSEEANANNNSDNDNSSDDNDDGDGDGDGKKKDDVAVADVGSIDPRLVQQTHVAAGVSVGSKTKAIRALIDRVIRIAVDTATSFLDIFVDTPNQMPYYFRLAIAHLVSIVQRRFPDSTKAQVRSALCRYLFVALFIPAVSDPRKNGLVTGWKFGRRTLKNFAVVAKLLKSAVDAKPFGKPSVRAHIEKFVNLAKVSLRLYMGSLLSVFGDLSRGLSPRQLLYAGHITRHKKLRGMHTSVLAREADVLFMYNALFDHRDSSSAVTADARLATRVQVLVKKVGVPKRLRALERLGVDFLRDVHIISVPAVDDSSIDECENECENECGNKRGGAPTSKKDCNVCNDSDEQYFILRNPPPLFDTPKPLVMRLWDVLKDLALEFAPRAAVDLRMPVTVESYLGQCRENVVMRQDLLQDPTRIMSLRLRMDALLIALEKEPLRSPLSSDPTFRELLAYMEHVIQFQNRRSYVVRKRLLGRLGEVCMLMDDANMCLRLLTSSVYSKNMRLIIRNTKIDRIVFQLPPPCSPHVSLTTTPTSSIRISATTDAVGGTRATVSSEATDASGTSSAELDASSSTQPSPSAAFPAADACDPIPVPGSSSSSGNDGGNGSENGASVVHEDDHKFSCDDIPSFLKAFSRAFRIRGDLSNLQGELIAQFMGVLCKSIGEDSLVHTLRFDFERVKKDLRAYILLNVFDLAFRTDESRGRDMVIAASMQENAWVTLDDMDVSHSGFLGELLNPAIMRLCTINNYREPNEKLLTIVHAIRLILSAAGADVPPGSRSSGESIGADGLLPMLIYCLLHSGLRHVQSNISFCERFWSPGANEDVGFINYSFHQFQSAAAFIEAGVFRRKEQPQPQPQPQPQ